MIHSTPTDRRRFLQWSAAASLRSSPPAATEVTATQRRLQRHPPKGETALGSRSGRTTRRRRRRTRRRSDCSDPGSRCYCFLGGRRFFESPSRACLFLAEGIASSILRLFLFTRRVISCECIRRLLRASGFTLIELLVVIAIIAVLIALLAARRASRSRGGTACPVHQQPQAARPGRPQL